MKFLGILALILFFCISFSQQVVVGSKQFPESEILGEIMSRMAEREGFQVAHKKQMGATKILWEALLRGDIDAYPEYTGTLRNEIFAGESGDLDELLKKDGLAMTAPLGFNNTYALGMKAEKAQALGITKISDLAAHPELTIGLSSEFISRLDGWQGLKNAYALPHQVRGLKHELAYAAMNSGKIDVTDLYSTDAEIKKYALRVLEDDKNYFPRYDAVIVYRMDAPQQAADQWKKLEGSIDEGQMIDMNSAVSIGKRSASSVAADFLRKKFDIAVGVRETGMWSELLGHLFQHLKLVGVSLLAAIAVAIPIGILATRHRFIAQAALGLTGIVQTIPSLALLVFFIPLFGVGELPAILALFLYSLLPIVRNTYAGLMEVPTHIRESAEALGLTYGQRLRLVYLPMASRTILAGIKTAAVINVGTATLGALIAAGGLGEPIIRGLTVNDVGLVLQGAIPAAALALAVQGLFDLLELAVVPKGLRI